MVIMIRHLVFPIVLGLLGSSMARAQDPSYDLLIRNGRIVDGTGNPWFSADLAIRGDRIVAIGALPENAKARRVIDAKGLIVAPGFIDMHSHSDWTLFEDGSAPSKIRQGVTTEVLGEDHSGGPNQGKQPAKTVVVKGKPVLIRTLGDYLGALEQSGVALNVATYVGLGNVWGSVMGDTFERPTSQQLDQMKSALDAALSDGAIGLSTMLAAPQEMVATTDDLVELCRVVRKHDGLFSSHIRNEGENVLTSVREAIEVGERSGVPVDIIHLKIADQRLWGRMSEIVGLIADARKRGVNVQANVYPYTRGNNDLVSILPPWAHEGGRAALLARLDEPAARERMKRDIKAGLPNWYNHFLAVGGDWSRMLPSGAFSAKNAGLSGLTMDKILEARTRDRNSPPDLLDEMFDLLREEGGSVPTIYAHHTEEDMNLALKQSWCSVGSDGTALAIEGPLRKGNPHPRSFGTFPRILGVYVRERKLLGLEDAVRKMTSLNASKIGLRDRGLLRISAMADVTIFDPERVIDHSTYENPFHYSDGIEYVIVNGTLVLDKGEPTAARPGKPLRHGR
jgi:N-acyl-D-aspartate/D-glutamate deacylase